MTVFPVSLAVPLPTAVVTMPSPPPKLVSSEPFVL
jgi:hypothetical protein